MPQVQSSDLYKDTGELVILNDRLIKINAAILETEKSASKMLGTLSSTKIKAGSNDTIKQLSVEAQKLALANEKLKQEQVKTAIAQERLTAIQKKASEQTVKLTREQQAQAKVTAAAKGSYDALSASMALNLIRLHALGDAEGANKKQAQSLTQTIAAQRAELIRLDAQTGTHVRNVGNYVGGIKNFAAQFLGIGSAAIVAQQVLGDLTDTVKEFDTALTDLGNDTNLSGQALTDLGKAAIDLSGKYGTSAKDLLSIFQLLINARPELKDNVTLLKEVTENINLLSKAEKLNSDTVTGIVTTTASKFNISLTESAKIVDTLATASDNGLAKLPQLGEAIASGGDIAHTAGLDLKGYTDIVEAMAAATKDGVVDGGKLAKLFLILSKTGKDELNPALRPIPEILRTLDKQMGITAGSTDALSKVQALFGPKAGALAISLIKQADAIEALNNKSVEYNAALSDAIANTDTLTGHTAQFKEEVHKTALEVDSGAGAVSRFIKAVVDLGTSIVITAQNFANDFPIILTRLTTLGIVRGGLLAQEKEAIDQQKKFAKGQADILDQTDELTKSTYEQSGAFVKLNTQADTGTKTTKELRAELSSLKDDLLAAKESGDQDAISSITEKISKLKEKLGITGPDVFKFANGTIGFLNDKISDLNKSLQNTTSQTVITQTTKQIIELEKEVARIQALLNKAREDATTGPRQTSFKPLPSLTKEDILGNVGSATNDLFFKSLEDKNDRELKIIKDFAKIKQDTVNGLREKELADAEAAAKSHKDIDLFSILNIDITDEKKQALSQAAEFIKSQIQSLFDFQNKLDQQAIDRSNNKVQNAQTNLDRELQFLRDGQANKAGIAQRELNAAKKQQEESIKLQQKHQKEQLAINTALEASNLFVAIAKLLAEFPVAGPFLAAGMIGAFLAAKVKAFQAVDKQTFRTGDIEFIEGGSHESGKDTFVGKDNKGRPKFAERGEANVIVTKHGVDKLGRTGLSSIFNAINKGQFFEKYQEVERTANSMPSMTNIININTSRMENELSAIRKQGESRSYVNPLGQLVTIRGGRTTIHI